MNFLKLMLSSGVLAAVLASCDVAQDEMLALLIFESEPSNPGSYEITVGILMDGGTSYSPSVVMDF